MRLFIFIFSASLVFTACSSTTEKGEIGVERHQLVQLVSSEDVAKSAAQSYEQVINEAKSKGQLDKNPAQLQRVRNIADKLIPQTAVFRKDAPAWKWEVHVITSDEINAWCMPGGKIAFYTAIIEKLNLTDAEIAAVMGHEISHALREHGRERMSQELIKQGVLALGGAYLESQNVKNGQYYVAGASILSSFFTLKYSRIQETEADDMGLELMARAGYNPAEAINLWKKMASQGGGKPPEILSTHPADETRIANLQGYLPKVTPLYEKTLRH